MTDQQEPKQEPDQQESNQEPKPDHHQDITKIDQQDIAKTDQQESKTEQQESKVDRFSRFVREMVLDSDTEPKTAAYLRTFTKWLFDLLRNILIVGFLFYLAKMTNSIVLRTAAAVADGMLIVYLLSYFNPWVVRPYQTFYRVQKPSVVDFIIWVVVVVPAAFLVAISIPYVANQIASGYGSPPIILLE
jgi:hypothetical protein